jgi:hypothetical protein
MQDYTINSLNKNIHRKIYRSKRNIILVNKKNHLQQTTQKPFFNLLALYLLIQIIKLY